MKKEQREQLRRERHEMNEANRATNRRPARPAMPPAFALAVREPEIINARPIRRPESLLEKILRAIHFLPPLHSGEPDCCPPR